MKNVREIEKFVDGIGRPKPRRPKRHSRKLLGIGVVLIVVFSLTAGAALLNYYGTVSTTANVQQSVLLDGKDYTNAITHEFSIIGGCTECFVHCLKNRACKEAPIKFETTGDPDLVGVDVNFYTAKLGTKGTATAEWDDTHVYDGDKSVHLETTGTVGSGDEARVVLPACCDMSLSSLSTISWWEYNTADSYPPHVDVFIDTDDDGEADDALVFEYAYNDGPSFHLDEGQPTYGALSGNWYQTFSDDGDGPSEITTASQAWLASGSPGPYGTVCKSLSDWQTTYSSAKIIRFEFEIDNWLAQSEAWIDNIEINGQLRQLEEWSDTLTLDSGEELCFYIEYDFDVAIIPGTYDIETLIVPVIPT